MEILDDRVNNKMAFEFVVHICGFRFDSLTAQPVNYMYAEWFPPGIPQSFGAVLDSSAEYWRKI